MSKSNDPRVVAIRANEKVGRGSCSSIDECMEDSEIVKTLDELGIEEPWRAVDWALKEERLFLEQGLNQRWGEDDDPQLKDYETFNS